MGAQAWPMVRKPQLRNESIAVFRARGPAIHHDQGRFLESGRVEQLDWAICKKHMQMNFGLMA